MVRSSSRKCPCSPSSPSVYRRGARLRELLKCTFPFPPAPPRQSTNSSPSHVRSTIGIADCRLPIGNCSEFDVGRWALGVGRLSSSGCHTIVPTGTVTILSPPARPAIFFPIPCPPFFALIIGSFAWLPLFHELIDARRGVAREFCGICCLERTFVHLLQRNETTSFTVNNDLFDSTDGAGYNRSFAGHRFKINDAEWLVDGRANEHRRVRVKFAGRLLIDHFVDPDDSAPLCFCTFYGRSHFLCHARSIWSGGAKHDLKIAIHELDCAHEMLESFLAGDSANKKQVRRIRINAITFERGR